MSSLYHDACHTHHHHGAFVRGCQDPWNTSDTLPASLTAHTDAHAPAQEEGGVTDYWSRWGGMVNSSKSTGTWAYLNATGHVVAYTVIQLGAGAIFGEVCRTTPCTPASRSRVHRCRGCAVPEACRSCVFVWGACVMAPNHSRNDHNHAHAAPLAVTSVFFVLLWMSACLRWYLAVTLHGPRHPLLFPLLDPANQGVVLCRSCDIG